MSIAEQVGKFFEEQNLKPEYIAREDAEPHGFLFPLTIENLGITVRIVATFYDDNSVHIRCLGIGRVDEAKKDAVFALLNEMNRYYRWTQFFVETDSSIAMETDQYFSEESAADITYKTMVIIVQICTDVYPKLMAALWGNE